ncbi:MAG TPA: EamA family transporter [Patescibacteria group bacterium]|nr:EamA family transporter [Patescibacteria group bacterium]
MWFLLALVSATLLSFRRVGEKNLSSELNHFTIGWLIQLLSLPFMVVALLFAGHLLNPFSLGIRFWLPLVIIWLVIYPLNTLGYFKALKHGQLSSVLPVHSLIPAMSLLMAWAFVDQTPSLFGTLGVISIVFGVYAINLKGAKLHNPLIPFMEDRSTLYMLLSAVAIALGGVLDKVAITASEPLFYNVVNTVGAVVVLFVIAKLLKVKELGAIRKNLSMLATVGTLQSFAYTTYLVALSLGPVAYVVSIRSGNVLIGVLIGVCFLKEKFTRAKALAFGFIVLGFMLLALG